MYMKSLTKSKDLWTNLSAKDLEEVTVPMACCQKASIQINNPTKKPSNSSLLLDNSGKRMIMPSRCSYQGDKLCIFPIIF